MDIIQETVSAFKSLIQRLMNIGELLTSNSSVETKGSKGLKLFWIFNW